MDSRAERLKEKYRQQYTVPRSRQDSKEDEKGRQAGLARWNTWQVKQKRPPTKENNDRCTKFPRS